MALDMIDNKLTSEDIELLKLEEKRRQLHQLINNNKATNRRDNKLLCEYREVKQEIKDIAYTQAGIFDDVKFGHLLDRNRNGLNLKLLQKWRLGKMEEMATGALIEDLKETLKEKEYIAFVRFNVEDKCKKEIANELDVVVSYIYKLLDNAEEKLEQKYDVDLLVEKLKNADIADISHEEESSEPAESESNSVEEIEEEDVSEVDQKEKDTESNPQGVFVAFDDVENIDQIKQLITMIEGVSHISEKSHEVEKLKKEVSSILDNY